MPSLEQQSANHDSAPQPATERPKTPVANTQSAENDRIHGLCAQDVLVANEDPKEFESLRITLLVDVSPRGALEQTLFNELMIAAWQMRRIGRMETELSAGRDSYTALLEDDQLQKKLDRLARHHSRYARTFHRSLKAIKDLQKNRAIRQEDPVANYNRPNLAAALPPKAKISKQTQSPHNAEDAEAEYSEQFAELDRFFLAMREKCGLPNLTLDQEPR